MDEASKQGSSKQLNENEISWSPATELTRLQVERKKKLEEARMNIRQSEEIKMMQRDAFDYVSPRSLDSSHGYRQSQMLLNTRAFKLKNEAKALQKKIEQIRKKAHDEAY